ncbi:MAG: potassium-transporting ATPase subunit C [Methanomethylovorans sp. PtaU1.Bin093]|uniref:potassium-transporting ATPase subunit KdpC n=1 Tax=Methanomethylovorans sp. PtaU1.Bin093 TaxID=1811679 RepID=UPI0009C9FE8D|nr:potassium-transporting ATPase subunit KdpC [Methanomethylovorans sp. PtaU1.Bin093]OPY21356.1 MAG: potassium-transporting ATPase subunit C [Methanomethylovorans sp. PtaU1.Bin093]
MKAIKNALLMFVVFSVLLGIIYPVAITGISQVVFPHQANGYLITENEKVIGSELIGQNFTSPYYFHGRPSATVYDSVTSGGSNLGPTNQKLMDEVNERIQQIRIEESLSSNSTVPADLVLSSGSGLEAYIYVESARLQIPRIAKARGFSEAEVENIVEDNVEGWIVGIDTPLVNVLKLNIALDNTRR